MMELKIMKDKLVGQMKLKRIYQGKMKKGVQIEKKVKGKSESIGSMLKMKKKRSEEIDEDLEGEIVELDGIKEKKNGDKI